MENIELLRRAEDLIGRSERRNILTHTGFLSPADLFHLSGFAKRRSCRFTAAGGYPDAERKVLFFLPDYLEAESFCCEGEIEALEITPHYGSPSHRDYLGAVLSLGIKREWVGDILVGGERTYLFCLPSVKQTLLDELCRIGRCNVSVREVALFEIPTPERQVLEKTFTVQSLRLDAVASGIFGLSRSETVRRIEGGTVQLDYSLCLKPDAQVDAGSVISIRGCGKGIVREIGGNSRKGRVFLTADKLI